MIDFDDDHGIRDENGNEQLIFQTTSSAVNQLEITNAATGGDPKLAAAWWRFKYRFSFSTKRIW